MRLVLIRHGHTSANESRLLDTGVPGADLDELGLRQAEDLVGRLADEPLDAVYSSNLNRARQTAAPLAAGRALTVTVLPGLREIIAGDEEMMVWGSDQYSLAIKSWGRGCWDVSTANGEDGFEFLSRFDEAVGELASAGHAAAALVSHGAALRVWCMHRIDGFLDAIGAGALAGFENTGFAIAEGDPDTGWRLVRLDGVHPWN